MVRGKKEKSPKKPTKHNTRKPSYLRWSWPKIKTATEDLAWNGLSINDWLIKNGFSTDSYDSYKRFVASGLYKKAYAEIEKEEATAKEQNAKLIRRRLRQHSQIAEAALLSVAGMRPFMTDPETGKPMLNKHGKPVTNPHYYGETVRKAAMDILGLNEIQVQEKLQVLQDREININWLPYDYGEGEDGARGNGDKSQKVEIAKNESNDKL